MEFKTNVVDSNIFISGYFLKGSDELTGIGRMEDGYGHILEGFFLNSCYNGYGRRFYSHRFCDIGEFKNGFLQGKGKRVYQDGEVEEGIFEDGYFRCLE